MDAKTPTRPRRSTAAGDDEAEFWNRWPRASRYWTAEERAMMQAYIPGWYPGCDLNGICTANKARNIGWREPLWFEWEAIRRAWPVVIELAPLENYMPIREPVSA